MSWYVVAWRDSSGRRICIRVPGLRKWFMENIDAIVKHNPQVGHARHMEGFGVGDIDPDRALVVLFKAYDAPWSPSGEELWSDSQEYFHIVDIVPEHKAPTLRFWDDDGWHWYAVDEETGKQDIRTVFAITQCKDVTEAIEHARERNDSYSDQVDAYDTEQWIMDNQSLRTHYDEWRKHMHEQIGVMPPPFQWEPLGNEPEESEDDATQG